MQKSVKAIEVTDTPPPLARRLYDGLMAGMIGTRHETAFAVRSFEDDPYGVLQPNHEFMSALTEADQLRQEAAVLIGQVVTPHSFKLLTDSLLEALHNPTVQRHREQGGAIVFNSNHPSVADQLLLTMAGSQAATETDLLSIADQTVIVGRLMGILTLKGFEKKLLDDLLLPHANALQTLPDSTSGRPGGITDAERRTINSRALTTYKRLALNTPGHIIWQASSGTTDKEDVQRRVVMGRVGKATAFLLYGLNQGSKNRLMTVPVFTNFDPFSEQVPQAVHAVFLEPRFLRNEEDAHSMMHEIATAGNALRSSDDPEIIYAAAA